MKYIIIKDDDASYFTPVDILEALYGDVLSENLINISVIPNVYSSIILDEAARARYYPKERLKYDPLISPEFCGTDKYYNVNDNKELINFLNKDNVEIFQHGYTHEKIDGMPEFSIHDSELIYKRAIEGKTILSKGIKKGISSFAPPWSVISREFIDSLQSEYKGVIASGVTPLYKNLDVMTPFYINRLFKKYYSVYKNILLIKIYDLIGKYMDISSLSNKLDQLFKNNDIIIVQNHYWVFLNKWKEDSNMVKQWKMVYNKILEYEGVKIISFNELIDLVKRMANY